MQTERRRLHPKRWAALAMAAAGLVITQPADALPTRMGAAIPQPMPSTAYRPAHSVIGMASWYGPRFTGKRTASGERFQPQQARTAAHRFLPFGTTVFVTNLQNARQTEVRITDRGPYHDGRMIDLSEQAARDLGMLSDGVARVRIDVMARN